MTHDNSCTFLAAGHSTQATIITNDIHCITSNCNRRKITSSAIDKQACWQAMIGIKHEVPTEYSDRPEPVCVTALLAQDFLILSAAVLKTTCIYHKSRTT